MQRLKRQHPEMFAAEKQFGDVKAWNEAADILEKEPIMEYKHDDIPEFYAPTAFISPSEEYDKLETGLTLWEKICDKFYEVARFFRENIT